VWIAGAGAATAGSESGGVARRLPADGADVEEGLAAAARPESRCADVLIVLVRPVGAGGTDGAEGLAPMPGSTSVRSGLAGTEATRSPKLTSDVAAFGGHGGAAVARTSPRIRAAWRSREPMKARPIPSSGRRLSPWLRSKGE